jgi:hypothetical protein
MWIFFAAFVIGLAASYAFAPKPQSQPSPTMDDIQVPTAEVGKDIPVLFGCREMRGPNVLWYGDLRTIPIKSEGGKK